MPWGHYGSGFGALELLLGVDAPDQRTLDAALAARLRREFTAWAAARSLSVLPAPDCRYVGRLDDRDVLVLTGIGGEGYGVSAVDPPLAIVRVTELGQLARERTVVAPGLPMPDGELYDDLLLFVAQQRPAVASVIVGQQDVAVRLMAGSGPAVVEAVVTALASTLRGIGERAARGSPYRGGR